MENSSSPLEAWQIGLIAAGSVVGLVTGVVLILDCARVFWFIRHYHRPRADPAKVAAYRKKMEDAYFGKGSEDDRDNPFRHLVSDEEFEQNLWDFQQEMDKKGASKNATIFSSLDESYLKLLRESIGVVIAPRAVLFQVAHPYVAIGIKQHSNIVRDTPKRFEKTYFHMFRMAFGTRDQAIKSARLLRKTHNRVFGQFDENVGKGFQKGHGYTAAHTHALLWVGLALAESVTFGYEMFVESFTDEEREQLAKDASYGMMLFGLPKNMGTGTYADFRVAIEACWTSEIITISEAAREISQHLLYPTVWYLKPVFAIARYVTRVIMPERYQMEFFGKKANLCDQIVVASLGGLLRFMYRLIPRPLRYIPEYSEALRRNGSRSTWRVFDPCARCMERSMLWWKDFFMGAILPAPNITAEERKTDHVDVVDVASIKPTVVHVEGDAMSAYQVQESRLDH